MNRPALSVCAFLAFAAFSMAAPNREPSGKSGPEEPQPIELTKLDMDSGAHFGDWLVWNHNQGGHSIYLVNRRTGLAIYLPWSSNGWLNYRTAEGT